MTGSLLQGSFDQIPFKKLLEKIVHDNIEGILYLRYWNADFNTKLLVSGKRLGGISGPFVPSWSKMLVPRFLSAQVYEETRLQTTDPTRAIRNLEQRGVLNAQILNGILQERATMGLLPLLERHDGRFLFANRDVGEDFISSGIAIPDLLQDLQQRASLNELIDPNDQYEILETSQQPTNLAFDQIEVLAAVANELSLVEIAKRTQLPWDQLSKILQNLESQSLIRRKQPVKTLMPINFDAVNIEPQKTPTTTPQKRIRNRLLPGDIAPDFELPGLGGIKHKLSDYRGKKVLLRFNRQAGCPICNPRNRDFIRLYPRFQSANVELIGIFGSAEDVMPLGIGLQNPPYPVLADPKDTIYAKYGVERSLWGMFSPQNWKHLDGVREGTKMETFKNTRSGEGEATRMPAEFLINERGIIEQVHYHAFAMDFLPLEDLFGDWLHLQPDA
jgi:peroxiredoxin